MSKGEETRAAILEAGAKIASKLGLEGLTIGSLAEATGMSKSGLFAHFGSREELQLAVLGYGAQRFGAMVVEPALKVTRGLPRLRAMFSNWVDWTIASGLPGGCILISAAYEYDDRPGPIRDAVVRQQKLGVSVLEKAVRIAIEEDHLRPDTDPEQFAFEMFGLVMVNHHHRRLLGDREAHRRSLEGFEGLVARHLAPASARNRISAAAAR
ncbi:MAG: TetR/AcrR family transcriptional regulator [Betaproteobacteria bacterium]|nr:TetR/AcrR family transcriptional regulator [Betaproteobacteria bacterium]